MSHIQPRVGSRSPATYLGRLKLFAILLGRESHRLDGLIAQLQAELDALMERLHGLQSRVDVREVLGLNVAGLVIDVSLNDAVTDGLFVLVLNLNFDFEGM